ncbi:MAG: hypothetical protein PUP92_19165 [Rhizonema sp. PD38]|nr:hypothetical protein [Rhizonema sp. PD38]
MRSGQYSRLGGGAIVNIASIDGVIGCEGVYKERQRADGSYAEGKLLKNHMRGGSSAHQNAKLAPWKFPPADFGESTLVTELCNKNVFLVMCNKKYGVQASIPRFQAWEHSSIAADCRHAF